MDEKRWAYGLMIVGMVVLTAVISGCLGSPTHGVSYQAVPGGDPRRGKEAVASLGCGSCHMIPGITGANGSVGPPLAGLSQRKIIAGELANTPNNLTRWIEDPQGVEPGNAMPDLGIGHDLARDIAAYLYTLN
jgi:cytochrome c